MTVQETILSFPGLSDFPEAYLETLLADRSLAGMGAASNAEKRAINLAIADALVFAVNMPDWKDNKVSQSYPRNYFINTARMLYASNGERNKANSLVKRVPRGRATNIN
jgi:hypothetical protein